MPKLPDERQRVRRIAMVIVISAILKKAMEKLEPDLVGPETDAELQRMIVERVASETQSEGGV